jgi:hypothetical protein
MADQVSIAGWVNIHSVPVPWMAIITKGDNAWRLSTEEQTPRFHVSVNDWDRIAVNGPTSVAADQWHHVAAIYDGRELKLYLDGQLESNAPWTEGIGKNDYDVLIGENAREQGRCLDGLLDDMRVYNYALTDSEVVELAAPVP